MPGIVDPMILKAFLNESADSVNQLESDLQALETDLTNMDLVNSVFRALHTIKGNSSFLDLASITSITHEAETILDRIRNGDDHMSQETIDVVFAVVDALRAMIADPDRNQDTSAVMQQLLSYSKSNKPIVELREGAAEVLRGTSEDGVAPPAAAETRVVVPTIRIEEAKIERMVNMVNELKIVRYAMEAMPQLLEHMGDEARELRFSLDLAISKMSRITGDLGALVYGARLVPVDNVFRKFPRVVRDLSQRLKKQIKLEIANGSAELDKTIVEAIADPMTHLIRNAVDHGIEDPKARAASGKPAQGTVTLNSFVDGNSVVIEIKDDGKGIDTELVARKAVEKGIISADKAANMSYSEKLALIFAPGFSTAAQVTDISGRGVGMDVVKSNINKLKGTVAIQSVVGEGTTIQLRFPLSVVVLRCLYVYGNDVCYAIPLHQVEESLTIPRGQLYQRRPPEREKHEILPVYSLTELLWDKYALPTGTQALNALKVRRKDGATYCLLVDRFSYMEEAIIHSVDSYISSIPGVQGGVIRKDGSVTVSINLDGLYDKIASRKPLGWTAVPVVEAKAEDIATNLPKSLQELLATNFKAG